MHGGLGGSLVVRFSPRFRRHEYMIGLGNDDDGDTARPHFAAPCVSATATPHHQAARRTVLYLQ
jgi:hypothetical protein